MSLSSCDRKKKYERAGWSHVDEMFSILRLSSDIGKIYDKLVKNKPD